MKSDALYELSSVISYFIKECGNRPINLRYFGFFHKNYQKDNQLGKLLGLAKWNRMSVGSDPAWKEISAEEYNFCLYRLSKYLVNREKLCLVAILIDLCQADGRLNRKNIALLDGAAGKLLIDYSWLANLKKLSAVAVPEPGINVTEGNIVLFSENDFSSGRENTVAKKGNALSPMFGYIYLQEEMTAFVRAFDKRICLNGYPLEQDKIYPLIEGDVLTTPGKKLTFSDLFRCYYGCAQFAPLRIEATETTPAIYFDPIKNSLGITGCSVPENGMVFYERLNNWLENYLITNPGQIKVNIRLDYFNTTSSKCILDILFRLQHYKTDDIHIQVNWFFQDGDEDLEEAGLNYSEIVKIPFSLIPYKGVGSEISN